MVACGRPVDHLGKGGYVMAKKTAQANKATTKKPAAKAPSKPAARTASKKK
jgi:hypothetical protein